VLKQCQNLGIDVNMPILEISPGLQLFYSDPAPEGYPSVILLHGLGATSESWGFQIPALVNEGFRVLTPDIRGFGKSTYPGGSHSIADLAGDIIAIMDEECISTAHLVGISMGGTIALQLACDHSTRFEKLVLINTFARLRPNSLQGWVYFATRLGLIHVLGLPTQARFVASRLFPDPDQESHKQAFMEQILQSDHKGYRATMRALMRLNLNKRLSKVINKTLVITGPNDFTVPISSQQYLASQIPNVRYVKVNEAGHAVIVEKPAEVNQILIEFLSNQKAFHRQTDSN
jgi:3-oxoadipate enol-lactonase